MNWKILYKNEYEGTVLEIDGHVLFPRFFLKKKKNYISIFFLLSIQNIRCYIYKEMCVKVSRNAYEQNIITWFPLC